MTRLNPLWHFILCLTGIGLALYSIYVESMLSNVPGYSPSCDISSWTMSCSKVFTSKYAKPLSNWGLVLNGSMLDLSLPHMALMYFIPLLLLPTLAKKQSKGVVIFRVLSYASVCFNLYLAYILKFVLGEVCIVCVSNYIVNLGLVLTVDNIARDAGVRKVSKNKQA